jgi:outer membrane protein, heavy metal efflux system
MVHRLSLAAVALAALGVAGRAAAEPQPIAYDAAIARARAVAPGLAAARAREAVASAEIGIAGLAGNPTVFLGTSTQAAKFSATASVPLLILGQRGAAARAAEADAVTVHVETELAWNEVRSATARAFVGLWLAESLAIARADAARLVQRLEDTVTVRIEVGAKGAAPKVEGLRVRAERLRADADAQEAMRRVAGSASELGRWIGVPDGGELRAAGDPLVPGEPPPLATLMARVDGSPAVRRENADARAAEARVGRERALVRPAMTLDLGVDASDPTLPTTNYRAQLGVEVPLFHQRGYYVERELAAASAARARSSAERARAISDLVVAYRVFEATTERAHILGEGVVPAAEAAAVGAEESYSLGYAPLVTVLDAERARIDARIALLEARATRALAWIDVERALGVP